MHLPIHYVSAHTYKEFAATKHTVNAYHKYAYYGHAHLYEFANTVSKSHRHLSHTCLIYVGSDSVKNSALIAHALYLCHFVEVTL
jgi:hypothetical protein